MRIVHEILTHAQVGGGGDPYAISVDKVAAGVTTSHGFRMSLLMSIGRERWCDEEAIEIEGDAKFMRAALVDALKVLDLAAEHLIENGKLDPKWNG